MAGCRFDVYEQTYSLQVAIAAYSKTLILLTYKPSDKWVSSFEDKAKQECFPTQNSIQTPLGLLYE